MAELEEATHRKKWMMKKISALKVREIFGRGNRLCVWQQTGVKRVELEEIKYASSGCQLSFVQSANLTNLPSSLIIKGWKDTPELRVKALSLCEQLCKDWDEIEINCDEVAESKFG